MTAWLLVAAFALLIANGFFVAVEFALIASRRVKLEALAERGDRRARRALHAIGDLSLQLAGAQLGITMASLGLGAVAEPAVAGILEDLIDSFVSLPDGVLHTVSFIVALTIVVFLHMLIGEMVPKNIAIATPERTMLSLATLNHLYVGMFRPLIRALNALANAGVRLFGVEPRDELVSAHTAEELADMLAASRDEGLVDDFSHELLAGALDFGGRQLASIVVPRDRVIAVSRRATVVDAERAIVEHGVSRLLVTGRNDDDVIGFVHAKDLLTVSAKARERALPLSRIRQVLVLDADEPLDDVLVAMRRSRTHVATVVDADRQFVGIATLEDVIEEVVGEITDESD